MTSRVTSDDFSYALYDLGDRQEYLRTCAEMMMSMFGGEVAGWNLVDVAACRYEIFSYPDGVVDIKATIQQLRDTADDNPMVNSYVAELASVNGTFVPRRLSDVSTRTELRRTRAWVDFLQPHGAENQLTIMCGRLSSTQVQCWGINRSGSDFTADNVRTARALQPLLRFHERHWHGVEVQNERNEEAVARLGLTHRELQVLQHVGAGDTAQAIAHVLRISPRTVRKHLENVYRKLGCSDRMLAANRARELNLI